MNDLVFLIINASVVCFIASYCVLKLFRLKVLLICLIVSPFILISILEGSFKDLLVGYLFVLQYGCIGIAFGILLFEIDQIKRARKLRYFTSFIAKIVMIFPCLYVFCYMVKVFISQSQTIENSLEMASMFGLVDSGELQLVNYFASFFHFTGVVIAVCIIVLCLSVLILNKYRAFKEVQRI